MLKLRARVTGSTPCERQARDRLFTSYDWCARNDDILELATLAVSDRVSERRISHDGIKHGKLAYKRRVKRPV